MADNTRWDPHRTPRYFGQVMPMNMEAPLRQTPDHRFSARGRHRFRSVFSVNMYMYINPARSIAVTLLCMARHSNGVVMGMMRSGTSYAPFRLPKSTTLHTM